MLKVIPIFMKCRGTFNFDLCNKFNTINRVFTAKRNHKEDENYFKSIIEKGNNSNTLLNLKRDDVRYKPKEEIIDESKEDGKMPILNDKPNSKKISYEEKMKIRIKKDSELDKNMKSIYEKYSNVQKNKHVKNHSLENSKFNINENENRENKNYDYDKFKDDRRSEERQSKSKSSFKDRENYNKHDNGKKINKNYDNFEEKSNRKWDKNKKKFSHYDEQYFERDRKTSQEEAYKKHLESQNEDSHEPENKQSSYKVKTFYEFDNQNRSFKTVDIEKYDPNKDPKKYNDNLMLLNKPIDLSEQENLDEEDLIIERVKNLKPAFRPFVYNLAYFVNDSKALQKFIEMGVEIHHWDKDREICEFILKLDFDKDIAPYLVFLHDLGIDDKDYSYIILKNPLLFRDTLDDLKNRIKYLESKKFTKENISFIITKAPKWLSIPIEGIDNRLGWLQNQFKLTSAELREIIIEKPKLGTLQQKIISDVKFCFKEFLSYSDEQIKTMIKEYPKLFTKNFELFKNNYNYLMDVMKINDNNIIEYPQILHMPLFMLRARYSYLKHLGLIQFDPSKPNFISLRDLAHPTDEIFCKKIAKTNLEQFEMFLKTI